MPDEAKTKSNPFWPKVDTLEGARETAKGGAVAAFIVTGITSALALYTVFQGSVMTVTPWSFLDSIIFLVIGIGIWKLSRVAAVAGLALYLVEQGFQISSGSTQVPVLALLFILYFIHGIRGTFSHAKLRSMASNDESTAA